MTPGWTVVITVLGCSAFWELIRAWIDSLHKKKFNIESEVINIKQDVSSIRSEQIGIKSEVTKLTDDLDEDRAITARVRILRFVDEMEVGLGHTKDSFDQVLTDIDTYSKYCADHPKFKNNQTAASCELIIDQYKECEKWHSFLYYEAKQKHSLKEEKYETNNI